MSITRILKGKKIVINSNTKNILDCLKEVLKKNGFEDGHESGVSAEIKEEKGTILQAVQTTMIKTDHVVVKLIGSCIPISNTFLLPVYEGKIDSVGDILFDEYEKNWIDVLRDGKKEPSEITYQEIKSTRILIKEILCRLYFEGLNYNGKLPDGESHHIWIKIAREFTMKILDTSSTNTIKLDNIFRSILADMNSINAITLSQVVSRIDDKVKLTKVIDENQKYLRELQDQVMRYIVVELVDGGYNDASWQNSMLESSHTKSTLHRQEQTWINAYVKKHLAVAPMISMSLMIEGKEKTSHQSSDLVLTCRKINLVQLNVLTKEEADRQQIISRENKKERIKQLYGLLNKIKTTRHMVNIIGDFVQLSGWGLLLLDQVRFSTLSSEINKIRSIFDILTDIKYISHIKNTALSNELQRARITISHSSQFFHFKELDNKELVNKIRSEFGTQLYKLTQFESILGCSVLEDSIKQQFIPQHSIKDARQSKDKTPIYQEMMEVIEEEETLEPGSLPLTTFKSSEKKTATNTKHRSNKERIHAR